jgi:hypothetical protein
MVPVGQNSMMANYIKPEQTFVVCPNQDVVYGAGFSALDQEPTVFHVPDLVTDSGSMRCMTRARTSFVKIGKP